MLGVAGGIAVAAIVLFVVMEPGTFRLPGSSGTPPAQPADLQLSIKEVSAEMTDEKHADLKIAFNVHNPNRNTAILETIHYTIYIGDLKMTSGDVGVSPQGFVASQEGIFHIVSNTTLTLKDTQSAVRNNLTAVAWDSMVEGTALYRIEGTFAFNLTGAGFQFTAKEKEFVLPYP
jgi:hypothetical protein